MANLPSTTKHQDRRSSVSDHLHLPKFSLIRPTYHDSSSNASSSNASSSSSVPQSAPQPTTGTEREKEREGWMASLRMGALNRSWGREEREGGEGRKESETKRAGGGGGVKRENVTAVSLLGSGFAACSGDQLGDGRKPKGGILIRHAISESLNDSCELPSLVLSRSPPSTAVSTTSSSSSLSSPTSKSPIDSATPGSRSPTTQQQQGQGRKIRFAPLPSPNRPRSYSTGRNLSLESDESGSSPVWTVGGAGGLQGLQMALRREDGQVVDVDELSAEERALLLRDEGGLGSVEGSPTRGLSTSGRGLSPYEGPELGRSVSNDSISGGLVSDNGYASSTRPPRPYSSRMTQKLLGPLAKPLGFGCKPSAAEPGAGGWPGGVPLTKSRSWGWEGTYSPKSPSPMWAMRITRSQDEEGRAYSASDDERGSPALPRRRAQYPPVAQRKVRMGGGRGGAGKMTLNDAEDFVEWGFGWTGQAKPLPGAGAEPLRGASARGRGWAVGGWEDDDGSGMAWLRKRRREREEKARREADEAKAATKTKVTRQEDNEEAKEAKGGEQTLTKGKRDVPDISVPHISPGPASLDTSAGRPEETQGEKEIPTLYVDTDQPAYASSALSSSTSAGACASDPLEMTDMAKTPPAFESITGTLDGSFPDDEETEEEDEEGEEEDGDSDLDEEELRMEEELQAQAKASQGAAAAAKEVYHDHDHHRILMQTDRGEMTATSAADDESTKKTTTASKMVSSKLH